MNQSLNKLVFLFFCNSNAEIGISTLQIFVIGEEAWVLI